MLFWLGISVLGIVASRLILKSWLNPLSLYSCIWGFCLTVYEWGLIQYYPISRLAAILIVAAWLSLYFGALIAVLMFPGLNLLLRQFLNFAKRFLACLSLAEFLFSAN
jgi:hypothetical protein